MTRNLALACMLSFAATATAAGPVADFNMAYDAAYASYRKTLFATNAGDADKSAQALSQLDGNWGGVTRHYLASPPPQFADDPGWAASIKAVTALVTQARAEAAGGDLAQAHRTLEGIRETLGALHTRNGIATYSDRMNAYHAQIEAILSRDLTTLDPATRQALSGEIAVLAYLAQDVLLPAPAVAGDPAYAPLSADLQGAVALLVAADASGDDAALRAAIAGLKAPYSRLFLSFG